MSSYIANYFLEFIPRLNTDNPDDTTQVTILNNANSVGVIAFSIPDLSFTTQGTLTKQLIVPKIFFDPSSNFMWLKPKHKQQYIPQINDIVRIFIGENPNNMELLTVCSISQEAQYDPATTLYTIEIREVITEGEDRLAYIQNIGKKKLDEVMKEILQQQNNTQNRLLNRGGYASYQFNVEFGSDYTQEQRNNFPSVSFNSNERTLQELRSIFLKRNDIFMFIDYINQTFYGSSNISQKASTLIDITLQKQEKKDGANARPIYRIDDNHIISVIENIKYNIIRGRSIQNQKQNTEINPRIPMTRQYFYIASRGSGANRQNYLFFSDLHINLAGQVGFHQIEKAPNFQSYLTSKENQDIILAFESNDEGKIINASNIIKDTLNRIAYSECKRDVYRKVVYDVTLPGTLLINQEKHNMILTKSTSDRELMLKNNPSKTEKYWRIGMAVELDISSMRDESNNVLFNTFGKDMVIVNMTVVSSSSNSLPEQKITLSLGPDLYSNNKQAIFSANSILTASQKQTMKNEIKYLSTKQTKEQVLSNYQAQRNNVIDQVLATIVNNLGANNYSKVSGSAENDFYETQRKLKRGF